MKGSARSQWKEIWYHSASVKKIKREPSVFFFYVFMAKRWVVQIVRQNVPFWMQCLLAECVCRSLRFQSNRIQSHLCHRPRTPNPVPLLPYFLTSFMGCHVSNGNENLCVCNWRRGAGSRSSASVPGRVCQHPRFLSHHFARLEPRSPNPKHLKTLNLKPLTAIPGPTSCWSRVSSSHLHKL